MISLAMKILLVCKDTVGDLMAGPGIRYFEMAKALSKDHQVLLAAPSPVQLSKETDFKILPYDKTKETKELSGIIGNFNVVIAQYLKPALLSKMRKTGVKYIADLYDPLIIETLEHFKNERPEIQHINIEFQRLLTLLQLAYADLILAASEKQVDYYYGLLSAIGRISAEHYRLDPTFEKLIQILPFGIEKTEDNFSSDFIKKFITAYSQNDKIIIWAGGIWNWFDPLTAIKAVEKISKSHPEVKLLFMAGKHPNPDIPEMKMAKEAFELSEKLGLTNKQVFFIEQWVPYQDRHQLLAASYLGISTHFDEIETRFSFRTRILDYIGHKLPIIATGGDSMAELISKKQLGLIIGYQNETEAEEAISKLITSKALYQTCRDNLCSVKEEYLWPVLLKPLSRFITGNQFISTSKLSTGRLNQLTFDFYRVAAKRIQLTKGFGGVVNKIFGK
jgi:glycosyltransferase involved in cell wall biosynthesis